MLGASGREVGDVLTRIRIRNFKVFGDVDIDLGNPVVFVGPNDSGKTTALQALALWSLGVRRWNEKRAGKSAPEKRPGVTINRKDITAIPLASARQLWRDLAVRSGWKDDQGKSQTKNILFSIQVEGVVGNTEWKCGLEFDYANEESIYCRPLLAVDEHGQDRMEVPPEAALTRIAFLPPLSGLAAEETRLPLGRINVLIGEGRTAEVLRNLCYRLAVEETDRRGWNAVVETIKELFGVELMDPVFLPERGEIGLAYKTRTGTQLDLSCSGKGMQQTLLLLAYLSANPASVLLLDEPDAHLEVLRQRHIYQVLSDAARDAGSQLVVASHSEVLLNEAADRDVVVAFLGRPHRIDDRGSQVLKALKEIGFEQYYMAEQTGWVLYLEGSSDLATLRAFAQLLGHPAQEHLERPFVHYVLNQPAATYDHFYGLREAKSDLVGFALYDHLAHLPEEKPGLTQKMWARREIENYFCNRKTLLAWAENGLQGRELPLLGLNWRAAMEEAITGIESAMVTLGKGSPWDRNTKVSDDFLEPLLRTFYQKIGLQILAKKANYHEIARFAVPQDLDVEITEVLNLIVSVAGSAKPVR